MCLAAKTPSTIAQQKAATTPKLMKTMEATNWGEEERERERGRKRESRVSFIALHHPGVFVSRPSKHGAVSFPVCNRAVCIVCVRTHTLSPAHEGFGALVGPQRVPPITSALCSGLFTGCVTLQPHASASSLIYSFPPSDSTLDIRPPSLTPCFYFQTLPARSLRGAAGVTAAG